MKKFLLIVTFLISTLSHQLLADLPDFTDFDHNEKIIQLCDELENEFENASKKYWYTVFIECKFNVHHVRECKNDFNFICDKIPYVMKLIKKHGLADVLKRDKVAQKVQEIFLKWDPIRCYFMHDEYLKECYVDLPGMSQEESEICIADSMRHFSVLKNYMHEAVQRRLKELS